MARGREGDEDEADVVIRRWLRRAEEFIRRTGDGPSGRKGGEVDGDVDEGTQEGHERVG